MLGTLGMTTSDPFLVIRGSGGRTGGSRGTGPSGSSGSSAGGNTRGKQRSRLGGKGPIPPPLLFFK
ncbi:hypothetical protein KI387_029940, partial [Taxus chinensis]